ncbi:hypothetical protein P3719_21645 [Vibrio parahaemolyticus]|uniref:Conjugal transfer protein TrbC n=2 Tax=Vibrio harveyi group TaxID=717610 RepID=A0AA47JMK6_VIBPH|nr:MULTISPECIES: hypothetical protein [Vibrio]EJG1066073.1 hypothetical protein [Vibrio parahaemolyticus O1]MDW1807396.1 hypothetical protein [Vibrio sp. Vb2362]MDW2296445.1 hypothetical protein [Vibrio sp. 1404]OOH98592.1 hypothetical protein BIW16_18915 [Vibrio sp. OULL4]APX09759.1 hypothetical protein BWP24_26470 [Vibrio campbellii]
MNKLTKWSGALGIALALTSVTTMAANETKLEQAAKNVDAISAAGGSATYTIGLWIGIAMIVISLATWAWNSRESSPQSKGVGKFVLICGIAGAALTFPSAYIAMFGEAASISSADESVDYRDLQNVNN